MKGRLKPGTSNNPSSGVTILQSDEVLARLRATDGHATRNVLKRVQNLVDRCSPTRKDSSTFNAVVEGTDLRRRNHLTRTIAYLHSSQTLDKSPEMLANISENINAMTEHVMGGSSNREELAWGGH